MMDFQGEVILVLPCFFRYDAGPLDSVTLDLSLFQAFKVCFQNVKALWKTLEGAQRA